MIQQETAAAIPTAVWSGSFTLLGVELKCHVLDNGKRIIEDASLADLMEAMEGGEPIDENELHAFALWRTGIRDG